jgi:PKD-like domain
MIPIVLTGTATEFRWTVYLNPQGIEGASGGIGSSINQPLVNKGSIPGTVTYAITPYYGDCPGTTIYATVTVNPCKVDCWTVKNMVASYVGGNTTFRWQICGDGKCSALSNITFGFPTGVTTSVSPANGSLYRSNMAIYRVVTPFIYQAARRNSPAKYGIKFEYVSGTTLKNGCDEFEYVLAGDQRDKVIDIIIKAGKQTSTISVIPRCGSTETTLPGAITQGPLQQAA